MSVRGNWRHVAWLENGQWRPARHGPSKTEAVACASVSRTATASSPSESDAGVPKPGPLNPLADAINWLRCHQPVTVMSDAGPMLSNCEQPNWGFARRPPNGRPVCANSCHSPTAWRTVKVELKPHTSVAVAPCFG
jgi:hypothetical protein